MKNILLDFEIDFSLVDNIEEELLYSFNILPIQNDLLYILVATIDTSQDIKPLIDLFNKPVKLVEVQKEHLLFALQNISFSKALYSLAMSSLENVKNDSKKSIVKNFLDKVFEFCILNDVSDIHIEAVEQSVVIRLRIDGVLNQFFRFDKQLYDILSSYIKLLGNLDISQRRLPLSSRFTRNVFGINYDFRISTLPTIFGESIVLRILDNQNVQKELESIGFCSDILKSIKDILKLNQGLILVTGPTGSGKTTTLYSMLNHLNDTQRKIITIEDPVEYKLEGVMQVNVNYDIELDYHLVLKNILRQDPDILMIGEIRDSETLKIALRAALTGHLVIATLHTNDAHETITRLLDLDAQSYLISATLKMIVSQRLLRVLCNECKEYDEDIKSHRSNGCVKCNITGYKGRQVVSEVLKINSSISKMISDKKSLDDIMNYAKDNGFSSLKQNSLKVVNRGITSLEEHYSKVSHEI